VTRRRLRRSVNRWPEPAIELSLIFHQGAHLLGAEKQIQMINQGLVLDNKARERQDIRTSQKCNVYPSLGAFVEKTDLVGLNDATVYLVTRQEFSEGQPRRMARKSHMLSLE